MFKKAVLIPCLFLTLSYFPLQLFSQNSVGIGTENPNENAVLQLVSPNGDQGLLIPKLSTSQRIAPDFLSRLGSDENGLMVFDSDENQFYFWLDTQWQPVSASTNLIAGSGIEITGNTINNLGDSDADPQNEIQDLQLTGSTLTISNNASATPVDLSGLSGAAPQTLTALKTGSDVDVSISDGNTVVVNVDDGDSDAANELQDISLAGTDLSISNGSTVDLSTFLDNTDNQVAGTVPVTPAGNLAATDVQAALTELQTDIDMDLDGDPVNEIQNISITGNAIGIDGGGTGFNLSQLAPGSGQVLKWNGTQWEAATDATAAGSTLPLLGNAQIVTNNGANTAVSVSGDINMDNTGTMTVQPNAITTSEILDLTLTDIDIDPGANIGVGKLNSSVMVETENVSLLNNDAGYLTNLATFSTDDLSEGISNLYYTDSRVDTRLAFNSVTVLSDVSNAGSGQIITAGERSGISTNSADIASLQASGLGFSQPPNRIYAGPTSGLAADPTFRTLVQADIPGLDASNIISGTLPVVRGGTNSSSVGGAGTIAYSNGSSYQFSAVGGAGQVLSSNGAGAPTWVNDDFGWGLNGNSGVNAVTDFVGSINAADVLFKSNNIERLRITSGGDVGVGGPGSAVTGNKLRVIQTLAASGDAIESVLNTTSPAGSSAAIRTVVTNSGAGTSFGSYSSVTNVIGSSGGGTGYFTILNGDGDGARSGVNVNISGGGTGSKYGYQTNVSTTAGANGYGLYIQDVAGSSNNYGVFVESISNEPSFYPAIFMDGNVGIGTMAPATEFDVLGTARMTGFQLTNLPTSGYVLTSNASGVGTWQAVPSSFTTLGQIPRGDGSGMSSSNMFSTGTNIGIGNSSPSYLLDILSLANGTVANIVNNHSGALVKRSLSLTSSATGTFTKQGIYNQVNGTPANGSSVTGVRNDIIPSGTGSAYGIYNDVSNVGTGDRMGTLHNIRAGASSASFIFGTRANISHDGTGGSFGSYVNHTGTGSGTKYGFYSQGEDINYFSGRLGVGVGSINPNYSIQIASNTAGADLQIGNSTAGNLVGDGLLISMNALEATIYNRENGALRLGTNGSEVITVLSGGDVGIGNNSPAEKLDINGSVQVSAAGEYKYGGPKTHIYAITPADFVILKNFFSQDYEMLYSFTGIEARVGSGGAEMAANYGAPIHLPDNAVISSIEVIGRNSSTTIPMDVYLVEKSYSTAQTPTLVATIPTNTGAVSSYPSGALGITVNNNLYNYLLRVEASTAGGSITGVKVNYEVLQAD